MLFALLPGRLAFVRFAGFRNPLDYAYLGVAAQLIRRRTTARTGRLD